MNLRKNNKWLKNKMNKFNHMIKSKLIIKKKKVE